MVTRRPDIAEGVGYLAAHHHVGRQHRRARCAQRCPERMRIHHRVGVEMRDALFWRSLLYGVDIARRMDAFQLFTPGQRRLDMPQTADQSRGNQLVFHRLEPRRLLRMMGAHVMQQAVFVCNERRRHVKCRYADNFR